MYFSFDKKKEKKIHCCVNPVINTSLAELHKAQVSLKFCFVLFFKLQLLVGEFMVNSYEI